jgi:hypothetical protein
MNRGRSQSLREEDTSNLTPALSLGERENRRQSQSQPMIPVDRRFMGSGLFRWELLTDLEPG